MKIEHRLIEKTPFGIQETYITDVGNIEIWGEKGSYQWQYTDIDRFPITDRKKYHNTGAALEAARAYIEGLED